MKLKYQNRICLRSLLLIALFASSVIAELKTLDDFNVEFFSFDMPSPGYANLKI